MLRLKGNPSRSKPIILSIAKGLELQNTDGKRDLREKLVKLLFSDEETHLCLKRSARRHTSELISSRAESRIQML